VLAFDRGASLLKSGDTVGAMVEFERALRLDPNNYPAEFYIGLVAFSRRQTDEAVQRWRRVASIVDHMPTNPSAEVMAARSTARANAINAVTIAARQYLEREQTDRALELLTELNRELPNNVDVAYSYALALNTKQRWRELLPVAQHAVELAPLSYGSYVLLYNAYAGQSQQAVVAANNTMAQRFGGLATAVREQHDSLPLQIEGVQVDMEGDTVTIHGIAVGTGRNTPVHLTFTLHGSERPVGTGRVVIVPPLETQRSPFFLTTKVSGPVFGVSYRVVNP
jgi:tetratricopeptide (TPR) repeat protein